MKRAWILRKQNPKLSERISEHLRISPITAQVLINRGLDSEPEAKAFLESTLFDLPSPFLMKGMESAVDRLRTAIERREKIAIYGDYDVDGITSTAILYSFLTKIGADVVYYNPERLTEGYGINTGAVEKLARLGVSLIVSGDCGITAHREVEEAKGLGVDFIVTDHHRPPDTLPDAIAILNPLQPHCRYPGKEIAGVGVIFNLVIALRRVLREAGFFGGKEPNLGDYLDLVALGTVADCASLTNVNRIFVKEGIRRMIKPHRPGIRALKEISGLSGEITSADIGFRLGPRVNASGRLASARAAVELLVTSDLGRARNLAQVLNAENARRQAIEADILSEAISLIEANEELKRSPAIVLSSAQWHPGVIGIAASRLAESYHRPVVLIALGDEGMGKGSGRGIEGLDLYGALSQCRELFTEFGGHELAVGFSIREEHIDRFRAILNEAVSSIENDYSPKIEIDCEVALSEVDEELIDELERLAPFGIGNPGPVFIVRSLSVLSWRVLRDKHLGLVVGDGERELNAIWFNAGGDALVKGAGEGVSMVFTPEFNFWGGERELRLKVLDVGNATPPYGVGNI